MKYFFDILINDFNENKSYRNFFRITEQTDDDSKDR